METHAAREVLRDNQAQMAGLSDSNDILSTNQQLLIRLVHQFLVLLPIILGEGGRLLCHSSAVDKKHSMNLHVQMVTLEK